MDDHGASQFEGGRPSSGPSTSNSERESGGAQSPSTACLVVPTIDLVRPPRSTLPPPLDQIAEPGAVCALLAAAAALAPVGCLPAEVLNSTIRVAIIGGRVINAVGSVVDLVYRVERSLVDVWEQTARLEELRHSGTALRAKLAQKLAADAALAGLPGIAELVAAAASPEPSVGSPPRLLLRDPTVRQVREALAVADRGVLIVDECKMTTMAGWGRNYDQPAAIFLNAAAAGDPLEVADSDAPHCMRMRCGTLPVVGSLTKLDLFSMHRADDAMLRSTLFAAHTLSPPLRQNEAEILKDVLLRLRALRTGRPVRFSQPAAKLLKRARTTYDQAAVGLLPPLSLYYAMAGDLMSRIAFLLHLLDAAAAQKSNLGREISRATMQRAIDFVQSYAMPTAYAVLGLASINPILHDVRRVVSFAQQYASRYNPVIKRRELVRLLQRSMPVPRCDRAIAQLVKDRLLTPQMDATAGQTFEAHPLIFSPDKLLPDLISDPRRPRS